MFKTVRAGPKFVWDSCPDGLFFPSYDKDEKSPSRISPGRAELSRDSRFLRFRRCSGSGGFSRP
jgi:hypothetical protein